MHIIRELKSVQNTKRTGVRADIIKANNETPAASLETPCDWLLSTLSRSATPTSRDLLKLGIKGRMKSLELMLHRHAICYKLYTDMISEGFFYPRNA